MLMVKNKIKSIVLMSIIIIVLTFPQLVSAHEMFYDGSAPSWKAVPLVWDERTSGKAHLRMNGDHLSADYSAHYITVSNAWPNASSKVSVARTTFTNSKVDLGTASESYWDDRWGVLYSPSVLGVCDLTSTDGYNVNTLAWAKVCSGRIRYAGILLTPYLESYDKSNRSNHIRKTMIHEIDHALGLGHPNHIYYPTSAQSVMRTFEGYEGYYTPRTHDINDLTYKYN